MRLSSDSRKGRPDENQAESCIIIGKVVSVNVPRSELRIAPETSHPERFQELSELRLKTKEGRTVLLALDNVRTAGKAIVAKVQSNDHDLIASTRGAVAVVEKTERYELPEDEYYIDDLLGLVVKDKEGSIIGRLADVWKTSANDIYQVLDDEDREILIPVVEDFILDVDIKRGVITADISILT